MTLLEIPDPLWNIDKVATYFGVDKQTIIRWIHTEGLEGKKVNNRWKVPQSKVYEHRDRKFAEGAK